MPTYKALGIKKIMLLRITLAIALAVDLLLLLRTLTFPVANAAVFASILTSLAWFYAALFITIGRALKVERGDQ
jgi:hypothetical protein